MRDTSCTKLLIENKWGKLKIENLLIKSRLAYKLTYHDQVYIVTWNAS